MVKKFLLLCFITLLFLCDVHGNLTDTLKYGPFGKVVVYHPSGVPESVVLFVSGDGGWNKGVVNMARNIVAQGALVVGIDIQRYFKNLSTNNSACYYSASDLEGLSMLLQKKYGFGKYLKPILVGYSSGATLVYGALAQAPANTFKGVIALGFCPDIEINKPLCAGSGLKYHVLKPGISFYLEANEHLSAPFIVLIGMLDQVCPYEDTKKFMESIPSAQLVTLPKVGHGFSVTKNWLPQFIDAYTKILKEPDYAEKMTSRRAGKSLEPEVPIQSDMPLSIYPNKDMSNLPLAFFISGDGGWTNFDETFSEKLAENGIPVIGLDAQKYFWNERQPMETARDLAYVVEHYLQYWKRNRFMLIGYSFGASAIPFIANDLNSDLKELLRGVYCLSPDETGDFEIHITDMLSISQKEKYNVLAELKKISGMHPFCVFGEDEDAQVTAHFIQVGLPVEKLPGGHHYNNDYNALISIILRENKKIYQ